MASVTSDLISKTSGKMDQTLEVLKHEYSSLKAGRANPSLLDRITVDYYGTQTPLNQVGNIAAPEPRLLTISLWDQSLMEATIKAIMVSDLGINPSSDGKLIRLQIPELTQERRKQLVKIVHKLAEEAKVAIRSIRRDCNDHLKKMEKKSDITVDDLFMDEKNVQILTDKHIKTIDAMIKSKESEVLAI